MAKRTFTGDKLQIAVEASMCLAAHERSTPNELERRKAID